MSRTGWTTQGMRTLLCSLAIALAACGGGDDPPAAPPPAPTIGAAGGTVAGPNGAQVVVPAGALAVNTAVAITQSSAGSPALPAGLSAVGQVFAFTPHGTTFAVPATVTVPFNAASVPAGATVLLFKTNAAGAWVHVPNATVNAATLTAQVSGFSWFTPVVMPVANVQVTAPGTATFSVSASGFDTPFSYQWQKSDDAGVTPAVILGATSASYTTGATAVATDNGDFYRVRVSNSLDTAYSNWATLTVTGAAPTTATLTVSVVGSGSVTSNPAGIDCGADCTETYALNTVVTLTPSAAAGFTFSAWSGDADCADASVTMSAARACTATFVAAPPAATGVRIAAGSDFSFARRANGDLYSWGSDSAGTLGAGNGDQSRNVPGLVATNNIANLAAGSAHGLAVRGTGEVRGWGYNGFGQLGDGTFTTREAPTGATVDPAGVTQYSDAVAVCGGDLHSLVLRSGGTVHAMGYNAEGQLGDGSNSDIGRPRGLAVPGIGTAVAIACGQRSSLALLANGTVLAWGRNNAGQLGDGTSVNRNTPTPVAGLTNVIAIAAGTEHSLALRSDGSVWAWGSNVNGMLGDGSTVNRLTPTATLLTAGITAIAAGSTNSLALRNDGAVLAWGINETGQLGSGSLSPGFRPQPAPVIDLSNVVAISFGSGALGHGLAVLADGTVWAWGDNMMGTDNSGIPRFGKLGNGSSAPFSATPVQVTGVNLN